MDSSGLKKRMRERVHDGADVSKLAKLIFTIGFLQIIVTAYNAITGVMRGAPGTSLLLAASAGVGAVVAMLGALALERTYREKEETQETIAELEDFNRTLRAQRHDFKNHVQVLSALLDMEEYAEARNYLSKVSSDLQAVGKAMRTMQPAVNALLQAKSLLCEKKGVRMEMDITARLETLPVASWEFCRVLGNLIDNAIEAQEAAEVKSPLLRITMFDNAEHIVLRVFNNGTYIGEELRERIFLPDISTKGEGRGMGLSIVSSVVKSCSGSIHLQSDQEGTTFEVDLPVRQKSTEDKSVSA